MIFLIISSDFLIPYAPSPTFDSAIFYCFPDLFRDVMFMRSRWTTRMLTSSFYAICLGWLSLCSAN